MTPEAKAEIDHEYTQDLVCPFCGYTERDSWEIHGNDEDGETDCGECGETYRWSAHTDVTYCTEKPKDKPND